MSGASRVFKSLPGATGGSLLRLAEGSQTCDVRGYNKRISFNLTEMNAARWETIERIYHSVCDASDRVRRLLSLCGDDIEVKREVESLLSANDQASSFLSRSAMHSQLRAMAEAGVTETDIATGSRLNQYAIEAPIGFGGMGQVY